MDVGNPKVLHSPNVLHLLAILGDDVFPADDEFLVAGLILSSCWPPDALSNSADDCYGEFSLCCFVVGLFLGSSECCCSTRAYTYADITMKSISYREALITEILI